MSHFHKGAVVRVGALENAPAKKFNVGGVTYQLSHAAASTSDSAQVKSYYESLASVLACVSSLAGVPYQVQFYSDFQRDRVVRRTLMNVIRDERLFGPILHPADGRLRIRFPCPSCALEDRHAHTLSLEEATATALTFRSRCLHHGEFCSVLSETGGDYVHVSTMLRNVLKEAALVEESRVTGAVPVIVKGRDWVQATDSVSMALEGLGYSFLERPIRIMAPLVEDWTGAKLSKSVYFEKGVYRDLDRYVDVDRLKERHGPSVINRLWVEVLSWVSSPRKFFRNYSIEYLIGHAIESLGEECAAILSVRERPARAIMNGEKRYEFRRRFYDVRDGTEMFVYVGRPVQAIVGRIRVGSPIVASVDELCELAERDSRSSAEGLRDYLGGCGQAFALPILEHRVLREPIEKWQLDQYGFTPPRSYVRLTDKHSRLRDFLLLLDRQFVPTAEWLPAPEGCWSNFASGPRLRSTASTISRAPTTACSSVATDTPL